MIVNAALSKHFSNPASGAIVAQGRMGTWATEPMQTPDRDQQ
ncbi:hypothetical protein [Rhodococcus sp. USK10]|nr:hypothetical protein [Rhodococcus sp. USK10]